MEKTLIDGAHLTDFRTVGGYNYYLYSRIDTYYCIMRENSTETEYRFFIGLGNAQMNTDYDAGNVAGLDYKRPSEMTNAQKNRYLSSLRGFGQVSSRDYK